MKNDLYKLSFLEAVSFANAMLSVTGKESPNPFSIPAGQLTDLFNDSVSLSAANADVDSARMAYHSAISAREAAHRSCLGAISTVARTAYANPSLTPSQIDSLGLKPRATTRTKIVPKAPRDLVAVPTIAGNVDLKWDRNGNVNGSGVVFIVESQVGTGAWTFVTETSKSKLTVLNYAVGEQASFRVIASKNGARSTPTQVAVVYPSEDGASFLKVA